VVALRAQVTASSSTTQEGFYEGRGGCDRDVAIAGVPRQILRVSDRADHAYSDELITSLLLSRSATGHTKFESAERYLGAGLDGALEIAEQTEVWVGGAPNFRFGSKAVFLGIYEEVLELQAQQVLRGDDRQTGDEVLRVLHEVKANEWPSSLTSTNRSNPLDSGPWSRV
jgi:hypothetical protein